MKILQNKRIQRLDSDSDDIEMDDKDSETLNAYTSYMTEVISAFVFFSNPDANLELVLPAIKESANKIVKTTKFLLEVSRLFFIKLASMTSIHVVCFHVPKLIEQAENITKSEVAFATDELLNLSLDDFQNATDQLITPKHYPIWQQYLTAIFKSVHPPINLTEHIILTSQADMYYLQHLVQYLVDMPTIDIQLYLWWTIVEEMVLHTTSDIRKLHSDYSRSITNLEGSTSRSLYCTSGVNQLMGMAVSYAIVQPDFLSTTKPKVQLMINNIRSAFDTLVQDISWMDSGTKCSTLDKSNAMRSFIGFPEWIIRDGELDRFYGNITFGEGTHLRNYIDVLTWQMADKLASLNVSHDIGWATTPTNVNAFHTFQANAISEFNISICIFPDKYLS